MNYKVNLPLIYGGKLYNIGDNISILEPTTLEACLKDNLISKIVEEESQIIETDVNIYEESQIIETDVNIYEESQIIETDVNIYEENNQITEKEVVSKSVKSNKKVSKNEF
ncbi:hypothetical protein [Streptobacillus moniliformis]|uniref:hypothetical protein n=1 Tax=Streptobacillus moniliformis TaxID=34105 RepID=UPI0007E32837|nr:hypothetical protein [Streptobacillus moniliformis]